MLKTFLINTVLLILLTTIIFYTILRQPRSTDFSSYGFQVCALVGNQPTIINFQEVNEQPHHYTFCNEPYSGQTNDGTNKTYIELSWTEWRPKDFAWRMTQITGGPSDPHHYVYRIDDMGKVQPLWHQHADYSIWWLSLLFSGFIVYVLNKIYRFLNNRRLKQNEINQ